MRTAIKDLIKLRVRTHTHTEILLTVVETLLSMTDAHASLLHYVLFQSQTMASERGRNLGDTVRNVLEALPNEKLCKKMQLRGRA